MCKTSCAHYLFFQKLVIWQFPLRYVLYLDMSYMQQGDISDGYQREFSVYVEKLVWIE